MFLRPPLRDDDSDFLPLLLAQAAFAAFPVFQAWHDDFCRDESPVAIILVNDGFHQRRHIVVAAVVQGKRFPSHELAHADRIDLDACLPGLTGQAAVPAFEDIQGLADQGPVIPFCDIVDAGRIAVMQMVLQTWPVRRHGPARPDVVGPLHEFQDAVDGCRIGKGAEIAGAVAADGAGNLPGR